MLSTTEQQTARVSILRKSCDRLKKKKERKNDSNRRTSKSPTEKSIFFHRNLKSYSEVCFQRLPKIIADHAASPVANRFYWSRIIFSDSEKNQFAFSLEPENQHQRVTVRKTASEHARCETCNQRDPLVSMWNGIQHVEGLKVDWNMLACYLQAVSGLII